MTLTYGLCFAAFGGALARAFTPTRGGQVARQLLLVAAVFQTLDASADRPARSRAAKVVRVVALIGIGIIWCCVRPRPSCSAASSAGAPSAKGGAASSPRRRSPSVLFWWRWHVALPGETTTPPPP